MDFDQAKKEYQNLKALYERGRIDAGSFEKAVYNLRRVDADGNLWQIGLTSGEWYRRQGNEWVEGAPPAGESHAVAGSWHGIPHWLVTVIGAGSVLTVVGCFVALTVLLIRTNTIPLARIITATPGSAVAVSQASTTPSTPTPGETGITTRTPGTPRGLTTTLEITEEGTTGTPSGSRTVPAGITTPRPPGLGTTRPTVQPTQGQQESEPTASRTPRPQTNTEFTVWKRMSYSTFENRDAVQGEWQIVLDFFTDLQFLTYKNRAGMLATFEDFLIDIFPEDQESYLQPLDIEIDEVFAFPADNDSAYVDFMCRFEDWDNTYSFAISRTDWDLYRYSNMEETLLAEGRTPDGFRAGDWGRLRFRCSGDRISIWLNDAEIVNMQEGDLDTGTWSITLYMNEDFTQTSLYFASHRIFKAEAQVVAEVLDRVQSGPVVITLDRGLRQEGERYSLGVTVENRSDDSLTFEAGQFSLQGVNGKRFDAEPDPPETGFQTPLDMPFSLDSTTAGGALFFAGVTEADIEQGLDLVIDLDDLGLSTMRFSLPTE